MRSLLATAALVGCSLAPHYERPRLPVPDRFADERGTIAAADTGWHAMFRDRRLQALIELALANNRDLRVAALNVASVRAQYQIQRAAVYPSITGVGLGAHLAGSAVAPGGSLPNIPPDFRLLAVSAQYELDLFGRVRNLTTRALETYLATVEAHRAAHLALVGQVAAQYLTERSYAEQYVVACRTERTTHEVYDLTRLQFAEGQRSQLEVSAAAAQWQNARAELPRLYRAWAQATDALAVLIGQPLPANLPPPLPLAAEQMIADLSPQTPSQVLLRRPDVVEAEHQLRAANANIGVARAMFLPNISIGAFAATVTTGFSRLFSSGTALYGLSGTILEPLFTGGANLANLDAANVDKRIRVAQYEKAIQTAFREVADALVARATLDDQLAAQLAQVAALKVRYDLSLDRYREGLVAYLDVLSAQNDLYASEQVLIQLRAARLANLADLYRALGGGWLE